jgi:hypothetical protein
MLAAPRALIVSAVGVYLRRLLMIHWKARLAYLAVGALVLLAACGGDILSSYW